MKTLIVALNSKYIHSALAPWYLKASCADECGDIKIVEYSINDNIDSILSAIVREKCDVAAFSCYIWNIVQVLRIVDNLKKISQNIKIILGGPEASFENDSLLYSNKGVDFVLAGEGEVNFKLLLKAIADESLKFEDIEGLGFRRDGKIIINKGYPLVDNLEILASPYSEEMFMSARGKIVYFESSRGCPFSCSYCISSTFDGVRYFSIEYVKNNLLLFIKHGVKLVKFVDRTFNCNRERAKEIFNFIIENSKDTSFHFEAAADLFDDDMINILSKAPSGLIQFEIGVQTTNESTLEAVNRRTKIDKVFRNIKMLKELGNIHIHLDLIAGLPHESFSSFKNSFNEIYSLEPQQLQLGFLKLLKGSGLRRDFEKYGYKFRNYPPYEILSSKYISYSQLMELKGLEEIVERYYNSGRFSRSIKYIVNNCFDSPYEFYENLSSFYSYMGYNERSLSSRELYTVILEFSKRLGETVNYEILKELLKFDFLVSDNTNNLPIGVERNQIPGFKEKCFDFLKSEENIRIYIPEFRDIPAKKVFNKVHFELFKYDLSNNGLLERKDTIIMFNYNKRNMITGQYDWMVVNFG